MFKAIDDGLIEGVFQPATEWFFRRFNATNFRVAKMFFKLGITAFAVFGFYFLLDKYMEAVLILMSLSYPFILFHQVLSGRCEELEARYFHTEKAYKNFDRLEIRHFRLFLLVCSFSTTAHNLLKYYSEGMLSYDIFGDLYLINVVIAFYFMACEPKLRGKTKAFEPELAS